MAAPPPKPPADLRGASPDASGRARTAGDDLADECSRIEAEVEELKVKYEMYFLGVELREPNKWRDELKKKVLRLKEKFTRNTGLRFRIQTLYARFLSYERLWQRSAREREEGTYRRDLERARRRGPAAPAPAAKGGKAAAESEDVDLSDFGAPAATARPGATAAGPAAAGGPQHHEGEDVDLSDFHDAPAPPAAAPAPAAVAAKA
ncbi:MAG TPA: hypothetical protein VFP50_11975, partial [Anaeromyxobacteraceae bacterium]|nr:hypothetical protein [Anaeromyxobacteraceae bacterium]